MVQVTLIGFSGIINQSAFQYSTTKPVTAGDLIIVTVATQNPNTGVASIGDNQRNNYNKIVSSNGGTNVQAFYTIASQSGTLQVQITLTQSDTGESTILDVTGYDANQPIPFSFFGNGSVSGPNGQMTLTSNQQLHGYAIITVLGAYVSGSTTVEPELIPPNSYNELIDSTFSGTSFETAIAWIADAYVGNTVTWSEAQSGTIVYGGIAIAIAPTSAYGVSSSPCSSLPYPFNDICNALVGFVSSIVSVGQGILSGLMFIARSIVHYANQIFNAVVQGLQIFYNALVNFGQTIAKAFLSALNTLGSFISTGLSQLGSGLLGLGNWIRCGAIDFVNLIINALNWLLDRIIDAMNYIINAMINGIDTIIGSAESLLITVQNAVVSKFSQVLFAVLTTPAELKIARSIFSEFTSNTRNTHFGRKLLGLVTVPIIASAISNFIAGFIQTKNVTKYWSRITIPNVSLPQVHIPTLTPCSSQTPLPATPPAGIGQSTLTATLSSAIVTAVATGTVTTTLGSTSQQFQGTVLNTSGKLTTSVSTQVS
jgi:hypothetical protein